MDDDMWLGPASNFVVLAAMTMTREPFSFQSERAQEKNHQSFLTSDT